MSNIFTWLDNKDRIKKFPIINQLLPVGICLFLFVAFMLVSVFFINNFINPFSTEKIELKLHLVDVLVGFFLYFITAIDYALIVGRMQITNTGSKARVIMNIFTCVGCFVGVSLVLFLWGFAKEIPLVIIPILIFAGSVMVKLAFEGTEYYEADKKIPQVVRTLTTKLLNAAHYVTSMFTFWIPELGSPKVEKMPGLQLAKWSFFLPFIIGLDDLIGYMGAMTIYNVFSLLFGIYLADILIDILIFVSPKLTKKLVENAILSLLAAYAFIYLGYKSFSEAGILLHEHFHFSGVQLAVVLTLFILVGSAFSYLRGNKDQVPHSHYPNKI